MNQTYFKALRPDGTSFYDSKTLWKPGELMPIINGHQNGPCGEGYHFGKSVKGAIQYAKFPFRLWEAEPSGTMLGEDDHKTRWTSGRITKQVKLPMWAKRAEKFIESIKGVKWFSQTGKPRKAWKMFDTWAAAWDAAGDAAWDAARDAAWAAAGAAAWAAAGDAARDAAWDAARAAARDAAWDAAVEWQTERLLVHYAQLDPTNFRHKAAP